MRSVLLVTSLVCVSAPSLAQPRTSPVHVENGEGVVVERQAGFGWEPVCEGRCDRLLSTGAAYRVNGPSFVPSEPFRLEPASGEPVELVVSRASVLWRAVGITGMTLGASAFGGGVLALAVGAVKEGCSNCFGGFANTTVLNDGWALVGGGVVAFAIGLVLVATNRHTTVASRTGDVLIPLTFGPERLRDAERGPVLSPPVIGLSLVGGTF